MKMYVTAFPIDKNFQKVIGIYDSGYVKHKEVGQIIESLTEHGYTECNSFTENRGGILQFTMHFMKGEIRYDN